MASTSFTRYKDFDISFRKNPVTKDVSPLTDANAVKRAVKLLVLTNYYERPFHPEYGSNVYYHLFENATPLTLASLQRAISEVIENFEPRAKLISVDLSLSSVDDNRIECSITFGILNIPEPVSVSFSLERLR